MTPEQQDFLLDLQKTLLERMVTFPVETNLQAWRIQEQKIVQWLTERNIPHQQQFAKVLTRAGLDIVALNHIASIIPSESVCAVLAWLKTDFAYLSSR